MSTETSSGKSLHLVPDEVPHEDSTLTIIFGGFLGLVVIALLIFIQLLPIYLWVLLAKHCQGNQGKKEIDNRRNSLIIMGVISTTAALFIDGIYVQSMVLARRRKKEKARAEAKAEELEVV